MTSHFDHEIDRRNSDSEKWNAYADDVLPMWVADMDFMSPQAILDALHARVRQGIFGYVRPPAALAEAICARMDRLYHWSVKPAEIVYLPGLVVGLNLVSRTIGEPGDGVLVNTPVYGPFLTAPRNQGRTLSCASQHQAMQNGHIHYSVDYDALEAGVDARTRLFILCNPHNPTGRAWSRGELEELAAFADRHDLVVCSDEIHCDLLHDGRKYIPFAALSPEISRRTITLMAPSKTFNIPSLGASFAIVQDQQLHDRLCAMAYGNIPHLTPMAAAAMEAAYTQCDGWLNELRAYLTANRNFALDFIAREMPQLRATRPEATYLTWIDCRGAGVGENADKFFLEHARVALSNGRVFGQEGTGYVRLNFGCTRARLEEGLTRMRDALAQHAGA